MKKFLTILILLLFIFMPISFAIGAKDIDTQATIVIKDDKKIIKNEICSYDWDGHLVCKNSNPDITLTKVTPIYDKNGARQGSIVQKGNNFKLYNRYNQKINTLKY